MNAIIPTIKVCNPAQKAELLANTFYNNHINNITQDQQTQNQVNESIWMNEGAGLTKTMKVTPTQIQKLIRATRPYKTPGNDRN